MNGRKMSYWDHDALECNRILKCNWAFAILVVADVEFIGLKVLVFYFIYWIIVNQDSSWNKNECYF